jgi:hypothetical protein
LDKCIAVYEILDDEPCFSGMEAQWKLMLTKALLFVPIDQVNDL